MTFLILSERDRRAGVHPFTRPHPFPVWRRIGLEVPFSFEIELARLAGFGCRVNDLAVGMFVAAGDPAECRHVALVRSAAAELGLSATAVYRDILTRAWALGLGAVPLAIAPVLRRLYWTAQPTYDVLTLAVDVMPGPRDCVPVLEIGRDARGRWLNCRRTRVGRPFGPNDNFIFSQWESAH